MMNLYPKIFNNIDDALLAAKRLSKVLPEDEGKNSIPECFKIESLANPYSGFENNAPDDKFIVCRLGSGRYSLKPNLHNHRFLYRGQRKFYKDCPPSLYRNRDQDYFIDEMIRCQEEQILMLSHPLVRLLDHGITLEGKTFVFEMNLYGLTQHYYNKTHFIDLSSDPKVAAFFATNKYNSVDDTYTAASDGIGCIYLYELNEATDFKPRNPFDSPRLTTIGLQVFPRSGAQRGFLFGMNKGENFNQIGKGYILKFYQRKQFSDKYNKMFNAGKTLFPDDILTHHWLKYNSNPKIVSKYAVNLNVSWNKGETFDSISGKLKDKGYQIEDYVPTFTNDELHDYYYSIPNFWDDFCEKIYFPGDKDDQLHQQLMDAKINSAFQWAFDENSKVDMSNISGYVYDMYQKQCGI